MNMRRMAGTSLVEIMIAIALGMMIMAALAVIFASSSRQRSEMERSSRQIENGRYAMDLIADDIRLAGFYGELNVKQPSLFPVPPALPDPCSTTQADWIAGIPLHVQGYDNGGGLAGTCAAFYPVTNTDAFVVRRVSTCEAGVAGCAAATPASKAYMQVSKCATQTMGLAAVPYVFGVGAAFDRSMKNCTTLAGLREYMVRVYFVSTRNGQGNNNMPTLMRWEFNGVSTTLVPLVEGIENVNYEYGIDWDGDGAPNVYTANPSTYASVACGANCGPILNWANVVTVRVTLLSRTIEPTPNYTDPKTYTLGNDAAGNPITVTPGGPYKRSVYSSLVRVVNAAERRDVP